MAWNLSTFVSFLILTFINNCVGYQRQCYVGDTSVGKTSPGNSNITLTTNTSPVMPVSKFTHSDSLLIQACLEFLTPAVRFSSKNSTSTTPSSSAFTSCATFKRFTQNRTEYFCDNENICNSATIDTLRCVNGSWGILRCCSTSLCNNEETPQTIDTPSSSCFYGNGSSPDFIPSTKTCQFANGCWNRTEFNNVGQIILQMFDCNDERVACSNGDYRHQSTCRETVLSGRNQSTCLCFENLCNGRDTAVHTTRITYSTSPSLSSHITVQSANIPQSTSHVAPFITEDTKVNTLIFHAPTVNTQLQPHPTPISTTSHWAYLGTIGLVVVLGLVIFTVVAICVKRFRDRRERRSPAYTYAQLTDDLDLVEDVREEPIRNGVSASSHRDDYMLIG